MTRMAGTMLLLATLGGCTSITQSPGRDKSSCATCQNRQVTPPPAAPTTWRQRDPLASQQYAGMMPSARTMPPSPYTQPMRSGMTADAAPMTTPPMMPMGTPAQPMPTQPMPARTPAATGMAPATMQAPPGMQPTTMPQQPTVTQLPAYLPQQPNLPSSPAVQSPVNPQTPPMPLPPAPMPASTNLGPSVALQPPPISTGSWPTGQVVENTSARVPSPETMREVVNAGGKSSPMLPTREARGPSVTAEGSHSPSVTLDQTEPKGTSPAVRMVNSKRINLNYEIKDVGPSGISGVELWYTQDSRNWKRYEVQPQRQPPFTVEVSDEGLYGFTLVARSGVGLGKEPPQPGDLPQVWVEVDLTKPVVTLTSAEAGMNGKTPNVTIRWTATDKNLLMRPITLFCSEQPDGPWTPIAASLENTGQYVWSLGTSSPRRFYVRVEATDLVGNIGSHQLSSPLLIDMSQPSVSILAVEPGSK